MSPKCRPQLKARLYHNLRPFAGYPHCVYRSGWCVQTSPPNPRFPDRIAAEHPSRVGVFRGGARGRTCRPFALEAPNLGTEAEQIAASSAVLCNQRGGGWGQKHLQEGFSEMPFLETPAGRDICSDRIGQTAATPRISGCLSGEPASRGQDWIWRRTQPPHSPTPDGPETCCLETRQRRHRNAPDLRHKQKCSRLATRKTSGGPWRPTSACQMGRWKRTQRKSKHTQCCVLCQVAVAIRGAETISLPKANCH